MERRAYWPKNALVRETHGKMTGETIHLTLDCGKTHTSHYEDEPDRVASQVVEVPWDEAARWCKGGVCKWCAKELARRYEMAELAERFREAALAAGAVDLSPGHASAIVEYIIDHGVHMELRD